MDGSLFRLTLALLGFSQLAWADQVNNEWLSGTRALSMGNVGIASADDTETTMFYNPAGLTRNKRTTLEIFNPQIEFGTGVFKLARNQGDYGKQLSLAGTQPLLQLKPHKASYLGYSLYPNVNSQNFGFGLLWRQEAVSYLNSQDKLEYHSRYLMIPTMGLAMNLLGNRFRVGAAVRAVQITANNRTADPTAAGVGYKKNAEEGFGLGLDAGAMLSLPWAGLPTLGFVARNAGNTSFSGSAPYPQGDGTVTKPGRIKMTYDAGIAFFPKSQRNSFLFAIDYRDVLNNTNVNSLRHVNIGTEFGFKKAFFLRFGYGRGYWTAGFGLNSKYGSFDLGTYGEELDARNFREIEDRRISLRLTTKF